jgi:hypothetical protein
MDIRPDKSQQILQVHARLIHAVVQACHNRDLLPPLEEMLRHAEAQGWTRLVAAVRQILKGRRDTGLLEGLDDEDRVIVGSVIAGLHDPKTLPDPDAQPEAAHAAPGLADMIDMARRGDARALKALGDMGEQMLSVGGDMARLAATFRPLIDGERDADKLARGMGPQGRGLLLSIIEELAKLDAH